MINQMNALQSGADLFKEYREIMKQKGLYDYEDMILWVLEKFKQDEQLLADYQEQYQYILVDEFQDTNGVQKDLLELLISFWIDSTVLPDVAKMVLANSLDMTNIGGKPLR